MAYRVRITRPAQRDTREHTAFILAKGKSAEAATKWLDGLSLAIDGIASAPCSYAIIPEEEVLGFPYRSISYHSHRIVYAVDEPNQIVVIHRVYHGARKALTRRDLK